VLKKPQVSYNINNMSNSSSGNGDSSQKHFSQHAKSISEVSKPKQSQFAKHKGTGNR
jgi:hypothetical protein